MASPEDRSGALMTGPRDHTFLYLDRFLSLHWLIPHIPSQGLFFSQLGPLSSTYLRGIE